ncbi:unnamed protein product [Schistosoma turkestanicum]|nr:unnamed protein product [Schistosoma turkestanicum]
MIVRNNSVLGQNISSEIVNNNITNTTTTNTTTNSNNNSNIVHSLSTGALVGLIIGMIIITTITIVIIFWCIRLRHLYISQRHTKMYDPDMFQNSQIKNKNTTTNGSLHFSSSSHQQISPFPTGLTSYSSRNSSSYLQKYSMPTGQTISPHSLQRQFFHTNLPFDKGHHNPSMNNHAMKQETGKMSLYSGENTSYANVSQCSQLQSPNWTDHHHHDFNSPSMFSGTAFNFQSYHQPTTTKTTTLSPTTTLTTNEPPCQAFFVHPLQSAVNDYGELQLSNDHHLSSQHHSRLKSIALISHLNAFGLKNKQRLSQLTTKKINKLKESATHHSNHKRNHNYHHHHNNDGQLNPLPISEVYESESYHNPTILSDNLNFNTIESSFDNDYFLYSLQTAVFNGFISSNSFNHHQYGGFYDVDDSQYKMSKPAAIFTTPTIHEEFNQSSSIGEDLSLGNNQQLTSPSSQYYASNRNSRIFSPDNTHSHSHSGGSSRFKFPPPGPPVAGWANQFIIQKNNKDNALSCRNTTTSSSTPVVKTTSTTTTTTTVIIPLNEMQPSSSSQLEHEQTTPTCYSPSSTSSVSLRNQTTLLTTYSPDSILVPNNNNNNHNNSNNRKSISSVPPSPQHIPFDFIQSNHTFGVTSSSIIPRRRRQHNHKSNGNDRFDDELPIVEKNNIIIPTKTDKYPVFSKFDFSVVPSNSPTILTNNLIKTENNLLISNVNNTTNNITANSSIELEETAHPHSLNNSFTYSDTQHNDSGYHDSLINSDRTITPTTTTRTASASPSTFTSTDHHSMDLLQSSSSALNHTVDNMNSRTNNTTTTTPTTLITNTIFSNTVNQINHDCMADNNNNNVNHTTNPYVYCKLELPLCSSSPPPPPPPPTISQSIPVCLCATLTTTSLSSAPSSSSSASSSVSITSSIHSPSTGPSSANSTTVMLHENLNHNRKLSTSNTNSFNSTTNRNQTIFRSPSDPDVFFSFSDEPIDKSTLTQPLSSSSQLSNDQHQHQPHQHSGLPLSRKHFAPNGMMKLMMMSTLSDSFKYHLTKQKSENQLLTDRHDSSFDEISWDLQPTPLY